MEFWKLEQDALYGVHDVLLIKFRIYNLNLNAWKNVLRRHYLLMTNEVFAESPSKKRSSKYDILVE